MSWEATSWARQRTGLGPILKFVLLTIADNADIHGRVEARNIGKEGTA